MSNYRTGWIPNSCPAIDKAKESAESARTTLERLMDALEDGDLHRLADEADTEIYTASEYFEEARSINARLREQLEKAEEEIERLREEVADVEKERDEALERADELESEVVYA